MKVKFPTYLALATSNDPTSYWKVAEFDSRGRWVANHVGNGYSKADAQRIARNARRRLRYKEKKLAEIQRLMGRGQQS
jgi:CRISPR/Cas system Type II protein with McrA/HNH and RuvC-like nuclease domain